MLKKKKKLNINKKIKILGLSYKDKSLIQKLKKVENKNSKIMNLNFLKKKSFVCFENIDFFMNKKTARRYVKKMGKVNMIISRHFFEHNFSINGFFSFIKILIDQKKKSFLFLEMPDSYKQLNKNDYSMIWEQHKIYPTKFTLKNILNINNFRELFSYRAKYKYEDCLTSFSEFKVKFNHDFNKNDKKQIFAEVNMAKNYFKKFNQLKIKLENKLKKNIN